MWCQRLLLTVVLVLLLLLLPLRGAIVRDNAVRSSTDHRQLEVAYASPGVQPADGRLAAAPLKTLKLERVRCRRGGEGARTAGGSRERLHGCAPIYGRLISNLHGLH